MRGSINSAVAVLISKKAKMISRTVVVGGNIVAREGAIVTMILKMLVFRKEALSTA
jgi:hypothetical protein